jgi:hypothetical protein
LHGLATTLHPAQLAVDVSRAASISCTILRQRRYLTTDVVSNVRWVAVAVSMLCEMKLVDALHYLCECLELITEPLLYLDWCERRVREAERKRWVVRKFIEDMRDDPLSAGVTMSLVLGKRESTDIVLVHSLRILARDIQSEDGVANAAIAEAADRLEALSESIGKIRADVQLLRGRRVFLLNRKERMNDKPTNGR